MDVQGNEGINKFQKIMKKLSLSVVMIAAISLSALFSGCKRGPENTGATDVPEIQSKHSMSETPVDSVGENTNPPITLKTNVVAKTVKETKETTVTLPGLTSPLPSNLTAVTNQGSSINIGTNNGPVFVNSPIRLDGGDFNLGASSSGNVDRIRRPRFWPFNSKPTGPFDILSRDQMCDTNVISHAATFKVAPGVDIAYRYPSRVPAGMEGVWRWDVTPTLTQSWKAESAFNQSSEDDPDWVIAKDYEKGPINSLRVHNYGKQEKDPDVEVTFYVKLTKI